MNTHSVAAVAYFSLLPASSILSGPIRVEPKGLMTDGSDRPLLSTWAFNTSRDLQNYAGWFAPKLYKIVKHCVPKLPSIAPNSSQFYHCLRPYQPINPRFQQAQSPPLPFTASRGTAALTVPDTRVPLGVTLLEGSRTVAMADQTTVAWKDGVLIVAFFTKLE